MATAARLRIAEGANPNDTIVGDPDLSPHLTLQQQMDMGDAWEAREAIEDARRGKKGGKPSTYSSNAYRISLDRSRHLIRYVEGKITFDNFMEEILESFIMEHLIDSGHTIDWYTGHLRETQKLLTERGILKGGKKLIREDGEVGVMDVVEALGQLARADVYARIDSLNLPQFIKDFLKWCRTLIGYVGHMAEMGKAVRELADAGKLDKDFVQIIYDAAGITQEWWADAAMDSTHQTLANIATTAVQGMQRQGNIADAAAAAWSAAESTEQKPLETTQAPGETTQAAAPSDGNSGFSASMEEESSGNFIIRNDNVGLAAHLDDKVAPVAVSFTPERKGTQDWMEEFKAFVRETLADKTFDIGNTGKKIHFKKGSKHIDRAAKGVRHQNRAEAGKKLLEVISRAYQLGEMPPVYDEHDGKAKKALMKASDSYESFGFPISVNNDEVAILWFSALHEKGAPENLLNFYQFGVAERLTQRDRQQAKRANQQAEKSSDVQTASEATRVHRERDSSAAVILGEALAKVNGKIVGMPDIQQTTPADSSVPATLPENAVKFAEAQEKLLSQRRLVEMEMAKRKPDTDVSAANMRVADLTAQIATWQQFWKYPELMNQATAWNGDESTLYANEPAVAVDLSGGNSGFSASFIGEHADTWASYQDRQFRWNADNRLRAEQDSSIATLIHRKKRWSRGVDDFLQLADSIRKTHSDKTLGDILRQYWAIADEFTTQESVVQRGKLHSKLTAIRSECYTYLPLLMESLRVAPKETGVYDEASYDMLQAILSKKWEKANEAMRENSTFYLDGVLHFPELFAAYPQLRNVRVAFKKGLKHIGETSEDGKDIAIRAGMKNGETINTVLHEVQHVIQGIEGFAEGGNETSRGSRIKYLEWVASDLMSEMSGLNVRSKKWKKLFALHKSVREELDRISSMSDHEYYLRLGGEQEARAVEKRRSLKLSDRLSRPMEEDIDFSNEIEIYEARYAGHRVSEVLRLLREHEQLRTETLSEDDREGRIRGDSYARAATRPRNAGTKPPLDNLRSSVEWEHSRGSRSILPKGSASSVNLNDSASFSIAAAREQGIMQDGKLEAANGTLYDMGGVSFSFLARHASPHSGIRKFLMEFIGTGEGAQMYGHGLYFSTNESVHDYYVKQFDNRKFVYKQGYNDLPEIAQTRFGMWLDEYFNGDWDADEWDDWKRDDVVEYMLAEAEEWDGADDNYAASLRESAEALSKTTLEQLVQLNVPAAEYEVMLNFDRNGDNLLRWDEEVPGALASKLGMIDAEEFAAQDKGFKKWAKKNKKEATDRTDLVELVHVYMVEVCMKEQGADAALAQLDKMTSFNTTGEKLYKQLAKIHGSPKAASEALLAAGIRGVEYRDGSRRRSDEDVTYNYVLFDESDCKIVRVKDAETGYEWRDYVDDTASFSLVGENAENWEEIKHLAFTGRDDGKLRVELDASQARIKPDVAARILRRMAGDRSERKVRFTLGDVLDYPELYRAYPKLAKMAVVLSDLGARGTRAWYNPRNNNIRINTLNFKLTNWDAEALRSTLLHEVQHAIQNIEGYASGNGGSNWDEYQRSAGEIEARAVQKRRNMTAEERAANPVNDMLEFPGRALVNIDPPPIEVPFNLVSGAFEEEWGALRRSGNKAHITFVQNLIAALNKDAERLARYQTLAEDERGDMAVTLLRATNLAKTAAMYLPKGWRIGLKPYLDWMEVFSEVAHHGKLDWSSSAIAPFWEERMQEHLKNMMMGFGIATGDAAQAMALLKDYGETRLYMLVNKLLKRVSGQLEEYGKAKLRDKIEDILLSLEPKTRPNRRMQRGVVSKEAFDEIMKLVELMHYDEKEYQEAHEKLVGKLTEKAANGAAQEEREALDNKLFELEVYGCMGMKSLDELDRLYTCLVRHIRGEKEAWKALHEARQQRRRELAEGIIAGVKESKGEAAMEQKSIAAAYANLNGKGQKKSWLRVGASAAVRAMESLPQLLSVLAQHKGTAALAEDIRMRLANAGKDLGIREKYHDKLFRTWFAQAFNLPTKGVKANFAIDKAIVAFNATKDLDIRLKEYEKKNLRLPLELALMRISGQDTTELRAELEAKLADLRAQLAEQEEGMDGNLETDKAIKEVEKRLAALDMELDAQDIAALRGWFALNPAAKRAAEILAKPEAERTAEDLQVINKTFKARHANITYNRFLREQQTPLNLSKNSALYHILAFEQEDNRARMEVQGWTADVINRLREYVGKEGLKLGELMREHLNTVQRARIAAIFERENGIPFANIPNYFPLRFMRADKELQDFDMAAMLDGMSGGMGGGLTGFLAQRTDNHDLPLAINLGATSVWRDAVATSEYWIQYQDIIADLRSVLGHKGVMDALTVQFGKGSVSSLRDWVRAIEQMGRMDSNARSELDIVASKAYNAGAVAILAYRVETLIKQFSGALNAWAGDNTLTLSDWLRGMSLTRSGKGRMSMGDMLRSDYIQSRIMDGDDVIGNMLSRMGDDGSFTAFERLAQIGMTPLSVLDAGVNAIPATVLFNAHFARAKAEPNPDGSKRSNKEAEAIAWTYTVAAMEQAAQPVNNLQKSWLGAKLSTNFAGRMMLFMMSESFNKIGLTVSLLRQRRYGKAATVWLAYGALNSVIGMLLDYMKDEPEDWEERCFSAYNSNPRNRGLRAPVERADPEPAGTFGWVPRANRGSRGRDSGDKRKFHFPFTSRTALPAR